MAAGADRIENGVVAGGWVCCQARHADDLVAMICAAADGPGCFLVPRRAAHRTRNSRSVI
jgi:hypothetical protein